MQYDLIGHLVVKILSLIIEFISNITEIPFVNRSSIEMCVSTVVDK